jgi:hypothetical protein
MVHVWVPEDKMSFLSNRAAGVYITEFYHTNVRPTFQVKMPLYPALTTCGLAVQFA